MTLDEAIKYYKHRYEESRNFYKYLLDIDEAQFASDYESIAEEHKQTAEWLTELKEVKELLKVAVEDIHSRDYCHGCIYESAEGKEQYLNCEYHNCFKWRYADEVEKLLND